MLILFTSDLHGQKILYNALLNLVTRTKPSLLILGGDLLPKFCNEDNLFLTQRSFIKGYLLAFFDKIQQKHPLDILVMLGNDDFLSLREELAMKEDLGLFHLIDNSIWATKTGVHVVGFNLIPETHFVLKDLERRDCIDSKIKYPSTTAIVSKQNSYEKVDARRWLLNKSSISEELAKLPPIDNFQRTIFVSHSPPYGTVLDIMLNKTHVGSKAVRKFIATSQPLVSLSGHIHEAFFMTGKYIDNIGRTICLGPGQIHYPKLDAVIFNLDQTVSSIRHTCKSGAGTISAVGKKLLSAPFS